MNGDASEKVQTPGHRVVVALGGVAAAARLAERSVKSVYRWLQPSEKGGNGGLIPLPAQRRMVANAHQLGRLLDFSDFAPRRGEEVL